MSTAHDSEEVAIIDTDGALSQTTGGHRANELHVPDIRPPSFADSLRIEGKRSSVSLAQPEKFSIHSDLEVVTNGVLAEEDHAEFAENRQIKRGLKQRHIQLIALAGTLGTGLFLGSGRAISSGGPVGALLGYIFVSIMVSCVIISVAELSALVPLSGGIIRHAGYFVDPALSFAQGWNQVYVACVGIPAEIVAAGVITQYWTNLNAAVFIAIFSVLLLVSNLCFVRLYGELEFGLATLKILLIVGLIIMGLVIDLGGGPNHRIHGFEYWRNPGPFVQYLGIPGTFGRFLGFWTTFVNASYAYSGIDAVATAAGEIQNPRQNIPKAAKRIFYRLGIFYILAIFIVTLIVPSNDPALLFSTGTAAQSPFVLAASRAGIKVVPHIINAVVLTSAWSAGNSGLFNGSRALFGLAQEGHAPRLFLKISRFGIPYVSVCFIGVFMSLGFLTAQSSASRVFTWLQELVASAALVHWMIICGVYLRFYYGLKAQKIDRSDLPWKGPLQPYAAWFGLVSFTLLLFTGGFTVFISGQWNTQQFFSAYFNIPLILVLYFPYKWVRKTQIVSLKGMPLENFVRIAHENPEPPLARPVGWQRLAFLWS